MKDGSGGVGSRLFVLLMAFCIGGVTLGLGLGVGYVATHHFLPVPVPLEAQEFSEAFITTVRVNPVVVPIDTDEPCFVDIIPEAKAAVVSINVTAPIGRGGRGEIPGSGSGFIFAEDDDYVFIATNNHVIENTNSISISLDDNENVPARVVGYDRASDVAVIAASKVDLEEKGVPFVVARLGNSDLLRMGDSVIAIGNAMGEGQTVTRGIISALSLSIEIPDVRSRLNLDVLQTDAAVNRGNSGGPLVNRYGEVIGIVTAKLIGEDIEGMGYALPINNVYSLLMDILETGSVRRTFIGINNPTDISEFLRSLFNLPSTGILVREIQEGSPADIAGILPDDLIIRFNNVRVSSAAEIRSALDNARPGEEATIEFYRDGQLMEVSVVLGSQMP
ncbi:MAG: trypsin-like peptidase domain-containing protein [Defluviitaleaceae bacterium]|nr:trypsin-like peptidase domain-containing protein [Defluviitaleaceae bacterium]